MAQDYKILGQRQVMNINPAGTGFVNDWDITYEVTSGPAKGTVATVTVSSMDHTADYVDQAIREKLDALHNISSLGQSD